MSGVTQLRLIDGRQYAKDVFVLIPYDWTNQDAIGTPVKWHCGDPKVEPWEWRMRVLEERTDIA